MKLKTLSLFFIFNLLSLSAYSAEKVFFIEPKNNAVVETKFHVKMGLEGRKICEAEKEPADKTCGHHHIVVDGKAVPAPQPITKDATHLHFGKGQTETDVILTPGKHTLTLQLADFAHRSYGESLSETIVVNVK